MMSSVCCLITGLFCLFRLACKIILLVFVKIIPAPFKFMRFMYKCMERKKQTKEQEYSSRKREYSVKAKRFKDNGRKSRMSNLDRHSRSSSLSSISSLGSLPTQTVYLSTRESR